MRNLFKVILPILKLEECWKLVYITEVTLTGMRWISSLILQVIPKSRQQFCLIQSVVLKVLIAFYMKCTNFLNQSQVKNAPTPKKITRQTQPPIKKAIRQPDGLSISKTVSQLMLILKESGATVTCYIVESPWIIREFNLEINTVRYITSGRGCCTWKYLTIGNVYSNVIGKILKPCSTSYLYVFTIWNMQYE